MEHKEIQTHLGDWGNLLFIKSSRLGINEEDAVTLCSLTFVEFLQAFLDVLWNVHIVLLFDATVLDLNLLFNSFDISPLYLNTSVCIIYRNHRKNTSM